ncbi:MAG: MerR family transcriptional regulator, partial [Candidatus Eremiobacterota bacterium]
MSIGELARRAGASPRALRHYEAVGLLAPARRPSGYREYDETDLARVREIRSLRDLGLSLRQVGEVLQARGARPQRLLELQLTRVERELSRLTALRDRLLRLCDSQAATREDLLLSLEALNMLERPQFDPILLELGDALL